MKKFGTIKSVAAVAIAGAMALGLLAAPASAEMQQKEFKVVGT